jgi:formylglycine-generating enzyme required for sulfatase activity
VLRRRCAFVWTVLGIGSLSGCQIAEGASLSGKEQLGQTQARLAGALTATKPSNNALPVTNGTRSTAHAMPNEEGATKGCPEGSTPFKNFCVDRYEAHLVVRRADGSFVPHPAHERPEKGVRYEARSKAGVMPQAYISREEARAACENSGKRLCSVSEWYSACRGSANTTYPYGQKFESKTCNVNKAHLLSRLYGANPRNWAYAEHFNNPALNQVPGFLAKTGQYSQCTNDSGTYDMVGNLHEWVQDSVDASLPSKVPLQPGIRRAVTRTRGHGIFMGGFFSTMHQHGYGCGFTTIGHEPKYHDYSTGFRCCADPKND